jgi:hypothetical protein
VNVLASGQNGAVSESCLRCGAAMEWRHQTWQCPRCRFKIGCCEGDAGCQAEPASPTAAAGETHLREPQLRG